MTVSFFGVATPASYGSLPTRYAELILERPRSKNRALRDFLDLFNHRLVSLFYRAWEKHRFPVRVRAVGPAPALFERALFALMGLGTDGLRGRLPCRRPRAAVAGRACSRWPVRRRRPSSRT